MKRLTCELCGSTDFVKESGMFVCQSCGCKYSPEEAKALLSSHSAADGNPGRFDEIANNLRLANSALDCGDGASAYDYASRILDLEPQNTDGWIVKMKSMESLGTLADLRLPEVISAGKNAVGFSGDALGKVEPVVYGYFLSRAAYLIQYSAVHIEDTQNIESIIGQFGKANMFLYNLNEPCRLKDAEYLQLYDGIANQALTLVDNVPDEALVQYDGLAQLLENCAREYEKQTQAVLRRVKLYGSDLQDSAKRARQTIQYGLDQRSKKALSASSQRQAQEKQRRIEEYWSAHGEEKALLESELQNVQSKIEALEEQLASLPVLEEKAAAQNVLSSLQDTLQSLGLFKSKEKKALQEKIQLQKKLLNDINSQFSQAAGPIQQEISSLKKRSREIQREFTKER